MRRRRGKSLLAAFVTSLVIGVGVSSSTAESRAVQPDTASPSQSSGLKFTPSADAYVSSAKPKANYGSATRLKVENAPVVETYLRFPGGTLTAPMTRATLWLYAVDGSSLGYTVHGVSDTSWQESSLTFANAPSISPTVVASAHGYSSGTWTTVDVTSLVASNRSANIALTSASTNALNLASRESGSKGPVLVVETSTPNTSTPDTSAPTTPSGLAVTGTTASSISLSWRAATDDVGVAGYEIYRNGSLAGTTQQAAYTLSGLACGSSYTVGVDSYDAADNRSPATTLLVSTAACPDTSPPSAPTGLTITSASATNIALSWTPSTDNAVVAGYDLFINGVKVGSTTTTSYVFGPLTCGTSYSLGVQGYDLAGNRSAQASTVGATTACVDTSAPTAPTGLLVTAASSTSIAVGWQPSFDNVGVTGYELFVNGSKAGSTQLTNYSFQNLVCGTSYRVGVDAVDGAGNRSGLVEVSASTGACAGSGGSGVRWRFAYSNRSDQGLMTQYGFNLIDVSTKSEADATPPGTQGQLWLYDYDNTTCSWEKDDTYVRNMVSSVANDPKVAGFYFSNEPDPFACPNAPQQHRDRNALIKSLAPTKYTLIGIDANWREHFDQYGTMWKGAADYVNYNPYICYVGKPCDFAWEDHVLQVAQSLGQPYFVALQAFKEGTEWRWPTAAEETQMLGRLKDPSLTNLAGYLTFSWDWQNDPLLNHPDVLDAIKSFNLGVSAGAPAADTTAPSAPTGLAATGSTVSSVSLGWNQSSDNVAVTGYGVYRNGTLVATTSGASYTLSGLSCGTSYSFSVDAYDAAGNRSPQVSLSAATGVCGDTAAPSAPTGLRATAATATSVSVSWTASSDNVGVAGYGVYKAGSLVGSTSATSFTIGGLACGSSYSIGVDAYDAAGNRSQPGSLTVATSTCDTSAPTAPAMPTAGATTQTSITLSWGASLDNVAVAGYDVFRDGTKVGSVTTTSYNFTGLSCATGYTLGVEAYDAAGNRSTRAALNATTSACPTTPPPPPPTSSDPVIAAAGDLCSSPTDCGPTATLLDQIAPDRVLTLGDNAYEDGTAAEYSSYYDPNWGRQKSKTSPAPGNHDYHTAGGAGYFGYFGPQAPAPYYSFDLGSWHLISLNGELDHSSGSSQETWLKNDLAAHPAQCTLAYWHEPRFSSGSEHGSDSSFAPFWDDLYAAGADIVLNGHDHDYERFAPQNPNATADPKGIREFVVGTGGASHYTFATPIANSEVRDNTSFGVIKLTLHPTSYDWNFIPIAGATFTDTGTTNCH